MKEERSFTSKILLFGEYSVIKYSQALAIPYPLFEGRLKFKRSKSTLIDSELKALGQFVKKCVEDEVLENFDENSLAFDIGQGLYFDSSIPQGFGVGSSGALCAAIAERYSRVDLKTMEIPKLRELFALLESHFHGSSSGFDPLVSYLNCPILVDSKKDLKQVFIPEYETGESCLFLLNTGRARRTEPLVNLFLEKCKSEDFDKLCRGPLTEATHACIAAFLEGDQKSLFDQFRRLSEFQSSHMSAMIPKLFQDLWQLGLESDDFALKLCGAGGGGFLLGISRDFDAARKQLAHHEIRPLFYF